MTLIVFIVSMLGIVALAVGALVLLTRRPLGRGPVRRIRRRAVGRRVVRRAVRRGRRR